VTVGISWEDREVAHAVVVAIVTVLVAAVAPGVVVALSVVVIVAVVITTRGAARLGRAKVASFGR
jgi:hypothetical protein